MNYFEEEKLRFQTLRRLHFQFPVPKASFNDFERFAQQFKTSPPQQTTCLRKTPARKKKPDRKSKAPRKSRGGLRRRKQRYESAVNDEARVCSQWLLDLHPKPKQREEMAVSRETWAAMRDYVILAAVLSALLVAAFMIIAAVLIAYQ
jgi:hypothetical protein